MFSYSCGLFLTCFTLSVFVFNNLHALFAKYPGVGHLSASPPRSLRLRVIRCLCFCQPGACPDRVGVFILLRIAFPAIPLF